jgi:arabinose-5-phosphate isomerase
MSQKKSFREIASEVLKTEAKVLTGLASALDENFDRIVDLIYHTEGRLIVSGIGKSANVAAKIVATLNSTGTPAVYMHAADATHGDLGIIRQGDIVMIISKSGNTPEIKLLTSLVKSFGFPIIGMTSNRNSYLAKHADYLLYIPVDREADPFDLIPTASTTAQMAMGDALAVCILQKRQFTETDFAKYHPGGSLGKQLLLKVKNILDPKAEPPVVSPETGITEIIHEITAKRVGATAVLDNNEIVGIITDGDIRRMLQKHSRIDGIRAEDIVSRNPKMISGEDLAAEALKKMKQHNINQLIVTDENGKYLGIVHLHELLKEGIL